MGPLNQFTKAPFQGSKTLITDFKPPVSAVWERRVGLTSVWSWSSTPVRHSSSISISRLSITVATFSERSWTLSLAWTYRAWGAKEDGNVSTLRGFTKTRSSTRVTDTGGARVGFWAGGRRTSSGLDAW
ncbi:hypothetical protein EYF80_024552 [Liparis tanakae]|uniref:Uncharacterized protein n=1 Tax=Liparis tanakae TaxID=230148 RepID=A0A4Z2HK12_9TELE|nr:hypothetical protein EYF80_024552 [Liparis tanakae]